MDENKFQIFNHEQFGDITVFVTDDGKILFKANDVAAALGYASPQNAVARYCKGVTVLMTPSSRGLQPTKYITEADVYRLIMRSKMPFAEMFQDWVCEEVLPSIRKYESYLTDNAIHRAVTDPDFLISLANQMKEERAKRILAEKKQAEQSEEIGKLNGIIDVQAIEISEKSLLIESKDNRIKELTPYESYVMGSKDKVFINQIAQDFGLTHRKLNALLNEYGVQYQCNGQWMLYAKYRDKGYVCSVRLHISDTHFKDHTAWTRKGRMFIYDILKAHGILPLIERAE